MDEDFVQYFKKTLNSYGYTKIAIFKGLYITHKMVEWNLTR